MAKVRFILHSAFWLAFYISATLAVGAMMGGLIFGAGGALTHSHVHWIDRLQYGLSVGGRYAGIWAGGMGIVLTVRHLYLSSMSKKAAKE
jgi:hypothetical protein